MVNKKTNCIKSGRSLTFGGRTKLQSQTKIKNKRTKKRGRKIRGGDGEVSSTTTELQNNDTTTTELQNNDTTITELQNNDINNNTNTTSLDDSNKKIDEIQPVTEVGNSTSEQEEKSSSNGMCDTPVIGSILSMMGWCSNRSKPVAKTESIETTGGCSNRKRRKRTKKNHKKNKTHKA